MFNKIKLFRLGNGAYYNDNFNFLTEFYSHVTLVTFITISLES